MEVPNSVFSTLGFNPSRDRILHDFYSSDPTVVEYLLMFEDFSEKIWEPACGNGNIVDVLRGKGYHVKASDIVDRGCSDSSVQDFLKCTTMFDGDIITNPPYNLVTEFVEKAYSLTGGKVAMFLKIQFLETIKRYDRIFSKFPPSTVYVFVKRVGCYRNDDRNDTSSAVCYCWVIWDKDYVGPTMLKWIPNHLWGVGDEERFRELYDFSKFRILTDDEKVEFEKLEVKRSLWEEVIG